jgi:hypothetical protein
VQIDDIADPSDRARLTGFLRRQCAINSGVEVFGRLIA